MAMERLEDYGAYQKGLELFDLVVEDVTPMRRHPETWRLTSQQVASADSICSNMEEGAGRWSTREYVHYLVISRGSAAETKGRYGRLTHWLKPEIVQHRVQLCDEIIGILTSTISTLKRRDPG